VDWIMLQGIGLVVVTLGIIGVIWGVFQKLKAGRVSDAPLASTGDVMQNGKGVAGPKGQISAQGGVSCQQPLIAPFSGTPCLYYKVKCTAEWKDGDTNKSKVIDEQKHAAQFTIDDGSGALWVDAREGGDFEPSQTKRETRGTGLLGGITGADLMFGNYRVHTGILSLGTKYTVEEDVLPMVPRLYACGKVADQGGAIASPSWRQLILSTKTRDELLTSATKGAKTFLAAGAALFFVGSGMCVTGQLIGGDEPKPIATAQASVVASTTTLAATMSVTPPTPIVPSSTTTTTTPTFKPTAVVTAKKPAPKK
jgi:E3 Ubiquitin ligase